MEETSATANNQLTLTSLPLPTLPFDLVQEILCKLLLQLRSACKLWDSLISDPIFAKKHLSLSTTHCLNKITKLSVTLNHTLTCYPLHSVLKLNYFQLNYATTTFTCKCDIPHIVGSCNGILCIADSKSTSIQLWNTSIRKIKQLPLFQKLQADIGVDLTFGFGYDSFADTYKVVVVVGYIEVNVHTLGTNFWRSISKFPFGVRPVELSGVFVGGRINWLSAIDLKQNTSHFIVSFDMAKESYQKVLPPDYGGVYVCNLTLSVLRDYLCITSGHDIWVMKEYGIQESWTKLLTVNHYEILNKAVYIFEDDQLLLEYGGNGMQHVYAYDSKNGTLSLLCMVALK